MKRFIYIAIISLGVVLPAFGANYGSYMETPGSPAICFADGDLFMGWARPDYSLKMGYFTLKKTGDNEIIQEETESLSDRTNAPFSIVSDGKKLALVWSDAEKTDIYLAYYKLKKGNKFEYIDTKKTGEKCASGVSACLYGDDLVIGYTDGKLNAVNIITYSLDKKKPKRGIQRKLSECETSRRSVIAIAQDILMVEWETDDGVKNLTTYSVSESSKGLTFEYLKEYPLTIKTSVNVTLTGKDNEFFVGYVDRNDKYMHVKSYNIETDNTLKAGSSTKIPEKPSEFSSFSVAVDDEGKIYAGYKDRDNEINLYQK
ncbi:MAG: hypothetical protein GY771_06235 [bacterium]|nr:hypothetical protein [bacterium]